MAVGQQGALGLQDALPGISIRTKRVDAIACDSIRWPSLCEDVFDSRRRVSLLADIAGVQLRPQGNRDHALFQRANQKRVSMNEQGAGESAGRQCSRELSAIEFSHANRGPGKGAISIHW